MILKGLKVFNSDNEKFYDGNIEISGEKIKNVEYKSSKKAKKYAIPGLVDVHFHGALGYELASANEEEMRTISKYEASNGVTTICPTFLTLPEKQLVKASKTANKLFDKNDDEPYFVGVNLEGPFVSKEKLGAQNPKYAINPSKKLVDNILKEVPVKLIDLAPELPGSVKLIEQYKSKINFSIAHTVADFKTSEKAIAKGANHITHIFNAMPPLSHKDPGVIGAAYKYSEKIYPELIGDSIHAHPEVVKMLFVLFKNLVLISDSMKATGLKDGESDIGGQTVVVKNKQARLKKNGALAGSVFNLYDCFYNCAKNIGISLEKAVIGATKNPAKSIGVYNKFGSISSKKVANILILDKNLKIEEIIIGGKTL